jgi:hypothetical protein
VSRKFDNWLKAYMEYTRASESPDAFHFWTGVATIAGALRRRVWIDQHIYKWTPNFYIVLVAPAGVVAKSTSIGIGLRLLDGIPGIHFGPSSMTWQAMTRSLADSVETYKYADKNGELATTIMSCLTIPVSELGTFLRPDDQAFVDVLTDMWDGREGKWTHKTITSGDSEVHSPWLNIIGATTPSWLRNNFPEHMIGGGLASRIIFVYGDKKRHYNAYPSRMQSDKDFKNFQQDLKDDLLQIAGMIGEYELTPAAYEWGEQWYIKLWNERPAHMLSDRYDGYIARKQTHMHKLAMVLAAARSNELVLDVEHLQEADELITAVEYNMIKVFDSIGTNREAAHASAVANFVKQYGFITLTDLWGLCRRQMPYKLFEEVLRGLVDAGVVEPVTNNQKKGLKIKDVDKA